MGYITHESTPAMTIETVAAFEYQPRFAEYAKYESCSITIEKMYGHDYREVGDSLSANPKGHDDAHLFQLQARTRLNGFSDKIGIVGCWNTPWGFYETHCAGLWRFSLRGQGWGIELYHQLIKWSMENDIELRSSKIYNGRFEISRGGLRVWNSRRLREEYIISKINGRYQIAGLTES